MKTLICTLNSKYIHSSLSVWCLFAACKNTHDTKVLEATVNGNQDEFLNQILQENPEAVTFSVYIWNREKTLKLCEKIKEVSPRTVIILGGPEAAYDQRNLLESCDFVNYVLSGEGEIILPQLLDCLSSGMLPDNIDGVSFRKGSELIIKKEAIGESFDYPSPYCEEYFNTLNGRITYIETSRGCPFSCAYCLSGRCGKVKFKSLTQAKEEILLLANSGTKTVKFVDRTFNCNNDRAVEILRFINENYGKAIPEGVCFHFEISADILKDSFILEASKAPKGAFQFETGIQSLNKATLNAIGRRSDKNILFSNIKKLVSLRNCHIHTDLIAGLPEENLTSFIEGFNECYSLGADMLQLGFLKLLHGSTLRDNSKGFPCAFSPEAPYEVFSTPTMTKEDFAVLKTAEKEVDRIHNSGRFRRTLAYIFESTRQSPFELFNYIGKALPDSPLPLDYYTDALYGIISGIEGINTEELRDHMIYDRIATNNSGIIPKSLFKEDKRLKKIKHILFLEYPARKGTSRNVAVLYTEKKVIFCDYNEKDPVTGEYEIKEVKFDFFGETFFDFNIDK